MGRFVKGDIVVLSYPFSDFSGVKRRPALVIADLDGDEVILCQITSQAKTDRYAIKLQDGDFTYGKLNPASVIRPNKIFTADSNIILYAACKISGEKTDTVIKAIMDIMNSGTENKQKGKIIFLNGVSSSGKSTLAKALQEKLNEPFYLLTNDTFCDMSPDKFINIDWIATYDRALKGMYYTIRAFSDICINTVVDDVLLKDDNYDRLTECVALIHDYPILFVHVICSSLEELRRREKERGDRGIGQGESQLSQLNPQDTYDITVDTFENTTEECADKIIEMLDYPERFTAFKTLWSQRPK